MIIGDTEQHNKICGFCGGNGFHRQHMCCNCNMISDNADNPNIKCTRKNVKETCMFIRWVMTTSEQNGNVMPCIPAHYEGKQFTKSKWTPAWWLVLSLSQNHIMPALFDHDFGGNSGGVSSLKNGSWQEQGQNDITLVSPGRRVYNNYLANHDFKILLNLFSEIVLNWFIIQVTWTIIIAGLNNKL